MTRASPRPTVPTPSSTSLTRSTQIDILDCNGGDHGYPFATNFNPEINLREVSAPGSYWEDGHWVEVPAHVHQAGVRLQAAWAKRICTFCTTRRSSRLAKNIPGVKRIRFFMTFGQSYLTHMKCLENVGMLSTDAHRCLRARRSCPSSSSRPCCPTRPPWAPAPRARPTSAASSRGKKDGKEKTYLHVQRLRPPGMLQRGGQSQAISYTTGVPAMMRRHDAAHRQVDEARRLQRWRSLIPIPIWTP